MPEMSVIEADEEVVDRTPLMGMTKLDNSI